GRARPLRLRGGRHKRARCGADTCVVKSRLASFCAGLVLLAVAAGCGGLQPEDAGQALREGGSAMAKLKSVNANLKFSKGSVSFRGFQLTTAKAALRLP